MEEMVDEGWQRMTADGSCRGRDLSLREAHRPQLDLCCDPFRLLRGHATISPTKTTEATRKGRNVQRAASVLVEQKSYDLALTRSLSKMGMSAGDLRRCEPHGFELCDQLL